MTVQPVTSLGRRHRPAPGNSGMTLSDRDNKALQATITDVVRICGPALRSISLRGEAAVLPRSRTTALELVIVVERVDAPLLRSLAPHTRRWHRRGISLPLVLDPTYIESSLDTFPLEFLELSDRRLHLWGDTDPFADLPINRAHLRFELEVQLRGKMLHLWEAYLETGTSTRAVRELLCASAPSFATAARALLFLTDRQRPTDPGEFWYTIEEAFGLELPVLQRLQRVRAGDGKLRGAELDALFAAYLAEVRTLVQAVDRL
jgi:hypothetical protein